MGTAGQLTSALLDIEIPFSNAPINIKPVGGGERRGIGWDFDIFQKITVKFPTPCKNVRSNIAKFPTPRNDLWSRARTKIQISLAPGQQENSNALPPGQSDRSKFRPMPRLPPRRLDIDRCIMSTMQGLQRISSHHGHACYIISSAVFNSA